MNIKWMGLPEALCFGAAEIAAFLGLTAGEEITVSVQKIDAGLSVEKTAEGITLGYHSKSDFFRAMSFLKRAAAGEKICETPKMDLLCLMADQSRNAVLSMEGAKRLLRHLAVMGYNGLQLYTEDTFEIPEYPYFGQMRGRFTKAELKELDAYAQALGIELMPCLQTLAHFDALREVPNMKGLLEIDNILMPEEESTYALIDAIFKTAAECFTSRRINIGMDEAHALGRGKYLDKHGYLPAFDIMCKHIKKVIEIAQKYGFTPMMWSDMFFRIVGNGHYHIDKPLPQEIIDNVPEGVELIYWDYYATPTQENITENMAKCHAQFKNKCLFAGGAWKWLSMTPKNKFSMWVSPTQVKHMLQVGMRDFIVTSWGDDGGEASIFSVLPTLLQYAEMDYGSIDADNMNRRALDCFGLSCDDLLVMESADGQPEGVRDGKDGNHPLFTEKYMLYSDPLNGLMERHVDPEAHAQYYADAAEKLGGFVSHPVFGYLYATQEALCRVLSRKVGLSSRIMAAYKEKDSDGLRTIAREDIPHIISLVDAFIKAFRTQWYAENKTFGFEVQEARLGGLKARLGGVARQIEMYLDGRLDKLEELEQPTLPFSPVATEEGVTATSDGSWFKVFSAGISKR